MKGPTERHIILFVLIIWAHCSWQVWCPFILYTGWGGECWHRHLSHEIHASGENLLMPPTVSGRNLNKEVKLNVDNFFCASWSYSPFLIFHTRFHIFLLTTMPCLELGSRNKGRRKQSMHCVHVYFPLWLLLLLFNPGLIEIRLDDSNLSFDNKLYSLQGLVTSNEYVSSIK